jgi:hypothetical protein
MTAVLDALAEWPLLAAALAVVLRAALAYQRGLTWPEYRTCHALKRATFPALDRREPLGYAWFVTDKGGRDDAEYLTTRPGGVRATVDRLRAGGGSLHLINAVKRRPATNGDPYSAAHVVWTHADGTQTEAYLFRNDDGTTDVYAHHEEGVTDPDGHLTGPQTDGDPRGVVRGALNLGAGTAATTWAGP